MVLRLDEATLDGFIPLSTTSTADDHKAYYPGATPITVRVTGDAITGRLLGAQLIGSRTAEVAKRVGTFATALFHEMTVADRPDGVSAP
jgi:NADPH-dependent 2,4-dienoyl-CoA reductase/sulfur reductase-like enzyme